MAAKYVCSCAKLMKAGMIAISPQLNLQEKWEVFGWTEISMSGDPKTAVLKTDPTQLVNAASRSL